MYYRDNYMVVMWCSEVYALIQMNEYIPTAASTR